MAIGEMLGTISKEVASTAEKFVEKTMEKVSEVSEYAEEEIGKKKVDGSYVLEKLDEIKKINPEQLKLRLYETFDARIESTKLKDIGESSEQIKDGGEKKEGLTEEQKTKIKEETGWSNAIIDYIGSWEEYEIYKKAGLIEAEIGGRKCLIRDDIDWGQLDEKGRTNEERVKKGLAPLDKNGDAIQLHHIGQHADSPLAELTFEEHRCNGNDNILHDKRMETETHGEGNNWDNERQNYWKDRANYNEGV